MKLNEIAPSEINVHVPTWLNEVVCGTWDVNPDESINVEGSVKLSLQSEEVARIPIQFADVSGVFDASYTLLETLEGAPRTCRHFIAVHCGRLKGSVDHLPFRAPDGISLMGSNFNSFHNIHKRVKECSTLELSDATHILGCLLVATVTTIHVFGAPIKLNFALNAFLRLPKDQQDINQFQEEMIDMGWEKYARL